MVSTIEITCEDGKKISKDQVDCIYMEKSVPGGSKCSIKSKTGELFKIDCREVPYFIKHYNFRVEVFE